MNLLALPNELLLCIAANLPSAKDISSFVRVCRTTYNLCCFHLFANSILSAKTARHCIGPHRVENYVSWRLCSTTSPMSTPLMTPTRRLWTRQSTDQSQLSRSFSPTLRFQSTSRTERENAPCGAPQRRDTQKLLRTSCSVLISKWTSQAQNMASSH
jgi:hypothetical protein